MKTIPNKKNVILILHIKFKCNQNSWQIAGSKEMAELQLIPPIQTQIQNQVLGTDMRPRDGKKFVIFVPHIGESHMVVLPLCGTFVFLCSSRVSFYPIIPWQSGPNFYFLVRSYQIERRVKGM